MSTHKPNCQPDLSLANLPMSDRTEGGMQGQRDALDGKHYTHHTERSVTYRNGYASGWGMHRPVPWDEVDAHDETLTVREVSA